MEKVKLDVLRPWISKKITEYLHIEDDVVVEFVYNQLEDKVSQVILLFKPCIKDFLLPLCSFRVQRRCKSI